MKMKLMAALLLAGTAPLAMAVNDRPYYAIQGSFLDSDNARNLREGPGVNLLFGLPAGGFSWSQYFASEFSLSGARQKNAFGDRDTQFNAGLDLGIYPFTRAPVLTPFLLIGSGVQYNDRRGPERGYAFINAGGGFLLNLDQKVALRVDAKRYKVYDNEIAPGHEAVYDTRINAGLQVAFDKPAPPPVIVPPPPPPPADTDGDGVPDTIDQCPGTPIGTPVNSVGCPIPPPPPPPPAIDSDGDGVLDQFDACPGTPRGLTVDERGCAVKEARIVLRDINFEFNKAVLTSTAKASLDKVAAGLRGQPSMSLVIEGHTDSVGKDAYNLKLSKQRAAAAKAYLVESGIEGDRLSSTGFGESKPVASNKTKDGRAENRRVEFKVSKQ